MDSTNHKSNIFKKKSYIVGDVYYAVKPIMTVSVLNIYRFSSLFPKRYNYFYSFYSVLGIVISR